MCDISGGTSDSDSSHAHGQQVSKMLPAVLDLKSHVRAGGSGPELCLEKKTTRTAPQQPTEKPGGTRLVTGDAGTLLGFQELGSWSFQELRGDSSLYPDPLVA